eukprot:UN09093
MDSLARFITRILRLFESFSTTSYPSTKIVIHDGMTIVMHDGTVTKM